MPWSYKISKEKLNSPKHPTVKLLGPNRVVECQ